MGRIIILLFWINTSFALDYYALDSIDMAVNGVSVRKVYLKGRKIEAKAVVDLELKDFSIVTTKGRVLKSKVRLEKASGSYVFDVSLNKNETGLIAVSTSENIKFVNIPKWKRENKDIENDYKTMEEIANQYTEEIDKKNKNEFKRRYGIQDKTYIRISSGFGYSISTDSKTWGSASGLGFSNKNSDESLKNKSDLKGVKSSESLYQFVGLYYQDNLIKYFVRLSPTFSDTLSYLGEILIGDTNYVIIYESQAESEKVEFPYLYSFNNGILGKRVEPIYPVDEDL